MPELTVVIPTHNRHELVEGAVASALAQTLPGVEVVVVDDGSARPVELAPRPGLRVIRRDIAGGTAVARNTGLAAARGRFVTFLDDDDRLLPHMAAASLEAIRASTLPPPVGTLSGIEVVRRGRVVDRLIPPTLPRGSHFSLEALPPGRSYMTKITLVAERDVLLGIGGFDESFESRQLSDLLWRLNPDCSLVGIEGVGYRASREPAKRLSRDVDHLVRGLERLVEKHSRLLAEHPEGHADVWLGHARMSLVAGPRRAVLPSIARALRIAPRHTSRVLLDPRRMARTIAHLSTSG